MSLCKRWLVIINLPFPKVLGGSFRIQGLGVIVFGFRPLRSEDWVGPLPYGHCMAHKWGLAIVILTYLSKWDGMILQVGFMDFTGGYLVVFFSKTGFS